MRMNEYCLYHFHSGREVLIIILQERRIRGKAEHIHTPHSKRGQNMFALLVIFESLSLDFPVLSWNLPPLYRPLPMFAPPQFPAFQSTYKACTQLYDPVLCLCIDLTGKSWCLEILILKEGIRGEPPKEARGQQPSPIEHYLNEWRKEV